MTQKRCILIGVPMDCGKRRRGCLMGPDSYRTAGIARVIAELGFDTEDRGNAVPAPFTPDADGDKLYALAETIAWTALTDTARAAVAEGFPIFMGGDHALSLGTVAGVAAHAAKINRPLFVLWLDAHPDYHTLDTTDSGNLHGTPLGYVTGRSTFAPAVGTTVPGGATLREAHLAMEMLHDSGLVTSLDLVELNPFLDERGRTASLMVDLTASLLGRRVFDRPTRSYS